MLKENNYPCDHDTPEERSWVAAYTIAELEYALYLGYKILEIYEVEHYPQETMCMAKYFEHLAARKCSAKLPKGCSSSCV